MTKRDSAVALAHMGFRVFRLPPNQKAPPPKRFYEVASSDPATVHEWWSEPLSDESTDHNIGISTDDLVVLDFDGKAGLESHEQFKLVYELDDSWTVSTPNGGLHVYFKHLGLYGGVAGSVKKIAPGIDVRSHHGYVLGPGSTIDGKSYSWVHRHGDAPPVAQGWLVDICGRAPDREADVRPVGPDLDTEANLAKFTQWLKDHAPEAIEGDGGNDTTLRVAFHGRDIGLSEPATLDQMAEHWNDTKAQPPWQFDELEHIVANAYRYAKGEHGWMAAELEFEPYICDETTQAAPKKVGKLFAETFSEAVANVNKESASFVIDGWLERGTVAQMYAPPNAGKSFLGLEMSHCVAEGRDFAGRRVSPGAVVYVALEGARGMRWRLAALAKHKSDGAASAPIEMLFGRADLLHNNESMKEIIAYAETFAAERGLPLRLIIIDTLARSIVGGNENDAKDMGPVIDRANQMADRTGAAVVLIHHPGKDASKGGRGSSAIKGAIDFEFEVIPDKRVPGQAATGVLWLRKNRDGDYPPPLYFRLEQVVAGTTVDLETKTSCVVVFTEKPNRVAQEADALDTLGSILEEREVDSAKWSELVGELRAKMNWSVKTAKDWMLGLTENEFETNYGRLVLDKSNPRAGFFWKRRVG